jgi:hypothetical protein
MGHWGIVKLLVEVLPGGPGKERLWRHIDRCPSCRVRLVDRDEARRVLFQAADTGPLDGLWPSVRNAVRAAATHPASAISAGPARSGQGMWWRWAAAAAGVGLAALLTVTTVRFIAQSESTAVGGGGEDRSFEIHYAKVGGQPAETFVFQSRDGGPVVVWVEKL